MNTKEEMDEDMEEAVAIGIALDVLNRNPNGTGDFTKLARALIKLHNKGSRGIEAAIEDVREFHDAAGISEQSGPPALVHSVTRLRLLKEEVQELEEAIMENDLNEVADAYADIMFIVTGSSLMHIGGAKFAKVWAEVFATNMAKCTNGKLVMREDGKILKPEGWKPPDIASILYPKSEDGNPNIKYQEKA
jgi:predicted HAD superfamily Cof-like phosphohydrolase